MAECGWVQRRSPEALVCSADRVPRSGRTAGCVSCRLGIIGFWRLEQIGLSSATTAADECACELVSADRGFPWNPAGTRTKACVGERSARGVMSAWIRSERNGWKNPNNQKKRGFDG